MSKLIPTSSRGIFLLALPVLAAIVVTAMLLIRPAPSSVAAVNSSFEFSPTPRATPTVHHRNPTQTPSPTSTAVPPTATPRPVVRPTATPSGGAAPQLSAPVTGSGSSGGGSFPVLPAALGGALGAFAVAGAIGLRRKSKHSG